MNKKLTFLCAATLMMAAIPCFAAASKWDGTWKLNQAKSKMTGATVTISQNGNMYTVDTGAFKFSFACDGKDYRVAARPDDLLHRERSLVHDAGQDQWQALFNNQARDLR